MSMRKVWALFLAALAAAGPLAAERAALVIGNGAYRGGGITELANPGNDARAVAGKLRGLGFAVMQGLDLDEDAFWSKVEEFAAKTKGTEAALLFYAGHGVQVDGENYLIPVDAGSLESKADLRRATLKLDDVLEMMAGRKNLVFLDACRNNPLGRGLRSRGNGQGMAAVSVESLGREFLIAYAAAKGKTAADGAGGNSPYTQALLKHLGTPGVSVDDMLTKVTRDVAELTGRKQIPWRNSSLEDLFYFAPKVVGPTLTPVFAGGDLCGDPATAQREEREWKAIEGTEHERVLEAYIGMYGSDPCAAVWTALAEARLEELRKGPTAPVLKVEDRFRDCAACPEMVVVPAGSFLMGSPESEMGRDDDEGPQHRVTIREAFAVGVYEVKRDEYGTFVAETGHVGGSGCYVWTGSEWKRREGADWRSPGYAQTGRDPVVCVSWEDAQAYVRWLSRKTGEEYRLLSEAEWEYAARAGTTTRYSIGDEITSSDANYGRNIGQTQPVGSYRANGFGLYDMHGNVWEWVRDCWNDSYAGAPNNGGSWERGDCSRRVLRGGSWFNYSRDLRSANRLSYRSGYRNFLDCGFLVARTLTP